MITRSLTVHIYPRDLIGYNSVIDTFYNSTQNSNLPHSGTKVPQGARNSITIVRISEEIQSDGSEHTCDSKDTQDPAFLDPF